MILKALSLFKLFTCCQNLFANAYIGINFTIIETMHIIPYYTISVHIKTISHYIIITSRFYLLVNQYIYKNF